MTDLADAEHLHYILDVLAITSDADVIGQDCPLLWSVHERRASFSMMCSDTFAWGCADAETIEPGDIPLLRQCVEDLGGFRGSQEYLGELFSARKRGMRPMNRWMKDMREKDGMPDAVYALFCTAGPARESVWLAP